MPRRPLSALPSVDRVLRQDATEALIAQHGRKTVTDAIRAVLAEAGFSPQEIGSFRDRGAIA